MEYEINSGNNTTNNDKNEKPKENFYRKPWFIIIILFMIPPIGIVLVWTLSPWQKKGRIIATVLAVLFMMFIYSGDTEGTKTYNSEITYIKGSVPESDEITGIPDPIVVEPYSYYVTGVPYPRAEIELENYSFSKSGTYIAGEDFQSGVYDIEKIEGNGSISAGYFDLDNDDNFKTMSNIVFESGDKLIIEDMTIEMTGKDENEKYIIPTRYHITWNSGAGNIKLKDMGISFLDMPLNEYMNSQSEKLEYVNFDQTSTHYFMSTDVSVALTPVDYEVPIQGASYGIKGTETTEYYSITDEEGAVPLCKLNDETVECSELDKLEELEDDINKQMKSEDF